MINRTDTNLLITWSASPYYSNKPDITWFYHLIGTKSGQQSKLFEIEEEFAYFTNNQYLANLNEGTITVKIYTIAKYNMTTSTGTTYSRSQNICTAKKPTLTSLKCLSCSEYIKDNTTYQIVTNSTLRLQATFSNNGSQCDDIDHELELHFYDAILTNDTSLYSYTLSLNLAVPNDLTSQTQLSTPNILFKYKGFDFTDEFNNFNLRQCIITDPINTPP